MTEALIGRLDRWLAANRPDYYALLRPGVTDTALDAVEVQFSVKLPTTFRQLYRWRDGQEPASFVPLQMNREFMTLEEITDTKDMLDGMIGCDFDDPKYWRRGWVPFLSNGGGSHLCVDVVAEDGGQPGQLVAFWKADEDRPVEYTSVEAWLADLVESAEAGELKLV